MSRLRGHSKGPPLGQNLIRLNRGSKLSFTIGDRRGRKSITAYS